MTQTATSPDRVRRAFEAWRDGISAITEVFAPGMCGASKDTRSTDSVVRTHDGVDIAFSLHGAAFADGLTVMLVHGWTGNRTYWDHQVEQLRDRYQVVAVDLGGHGDSGLARTVSRSARAAGIAKPCRSSRAPL